MTSSGFPAWLARSLSRSLSLVLATGALLAQAQTPAPAEGTLDKIRTSGKVVLGVREASPPMAYALGANERFVGYHVELCERVLKDIVPKARLEYMALTAQNTLPLVSNGTVDIGCGPTTNNLARQQQVAFALTTYVSEVRMAVRADSGITSVAQLAGRTVAATTGTTAVQLLRKLERAQNLTLKTSLGKDHLESFLILESGRADAFVLDDNLLAGIIANSKTPQAWRIVGEPLGSEPIALLFRKDDPAFKAAVDGAIRALMKSGELDRLYAKWFLEPIPPRQTPLNLSMSTALRQLIANTNDLPLESYAAR